ncbi:M48 family metalloprotease [Actinophytocola oryzae]|uniref:Peptidase M48-like protein n=1 Tax=Actinophytocola oryzae TaxID=502181 RepID=A0A4R7W375_9PSEU|nr:M48 family metalloprotease [Actinophytocola oryzae]TDV56498.1 peptidase M48-like protein [Actinophytocola oryzae]
MSDRPGGATLTESPSATAPRRPPSGMTVLFSLLVSVVVVTVGVVGALLWTVTGDNARRWAEAWQRCGPGWLAGPDASTAGANEDMHRFVRCVAPVSREQASWSLYAVGLLVLVALLCYAAYPAVITRRRGLGRFRPEGELAEVLEGLRRVAGLRTPPTYLLRPSEETRVTRDAMTFGAFRARHIALDMGLVKDFGHDRDRFRAVVLHELAHARGRDVHITYLTKAVWAAFVALAWVPAAIGLLLRHDASAWLFAAGLLVLTALVLSIRNAILRERELHADGVAAAVVGREDALRVLHGEERPGLWRRFTHHHPSAARRRRFVTEPALLDTPRWWELPVVGVVVGMVGSNVWYVATIALVTLPGTNGLLVGLLVAPALTAPVVVAVWRVVRLDPDGTHVPRWLVFAGGLALGCLVGRQLSLTSVLVGASGGSAFGSDLVAVPGLVVATLAVALWTASVAREASLSAVVVAVTAAVGLLTAVWWLHSTVGSLWSWDFYDKGPEFPDPVGRAAGWLDEATHWLTLRNLPLTTLVYVPIVVPLLSLLWLVPALVAPRVFDLRRALRAGLVGAATVMVLTCAAVLVARWSIPSEIRANDRFAIVFHFSAIVLCVVVQAVVAFLLRGPHRAVLVPLAATTTALLSSAAFFLVVEPLYRAVDLRASDPESLYPAPDFQIIADFGQYSVLLGLLVSSVAATLGALLRPRPAAGPAPGGMRGTVAVTIGTVVLAAATVPPAIDYWKAAGPSTTPAECLVGTWTERSRTSFVPADPDEEPLRFTGSGSVLVYTGDGRFRAAFSPASADHSGQRYVLAYSGVVSGTYRVDGDHIVYSSVAPGVEVSFSVDGTPVDTRPVTGFADDAFTCTGDTMTQKGPSYSITLVRVEAGR